MWGLKYIFNRDYHCMCGGPLLEKQYNAPFIFDGCVTEEFLETLLSLLLQEVSLLTR